MNAPPAGDTGARTLWLATGNAKKRAELERLLVPLQVTVKTLADAPEPVEIVEDCPDFAGNAAAKAIPLARAVGAVALGDDSGLCVDALDGAPGVRSARWAGPDATDADRIAKLLAELERVGARDPAARTARFVCALCLAGPDGKGNTSIRAAFQAECPGRILAAPRGAGGFGYDPVFVPDDLPATGEPSGGPDTLHPGQLPPTFAELTAAGKDRISHRGKALRQLLEQLLQDPALLL